MIGPEKTSLIYTNAPIHVIVSISYSVYIYVCTIQNLLVLLDFLWNAAYQGSVGWYTGILS